MLRPGHMMDKHKSSLLADFVMRRYIPYHPAQPAPKVWLQSQDPYLPSDIGAQLAHTRPEVNFNVVNGAPDPLTLDNLDSLNALGGKNVYLTSVDDVTKNPEWLKGVRPDGNGKTNGATSCAVIVNDHGSGNVDAYYFYFYAFDQGNTVFGQEIGNHVGDWEHNMIRFKDGNPQAIWNHDHTIPGLNLPAGPIEDHCDQGTLWDPVASAYFYSYNAASNTFAAYDGTSPTNWLQYLGRWGDQQYPDQDPRQHKIFGIAQTARSVLEKHPRKMAENFNDIEDLRHRKKSVGTVELQGPNGQMRTVNLEDLTDADAELAAKFGYKPVFKREFGYLSTFSFAVSISGLFSTVATTFSYPLYAGGASSAVWCWLISGAGCNLVTIEFYARHADSTLIRRITGWLNLLGQIAGLASSEYGAALLLLAAVSMGSDFTYLPTTGTVIGVMAALSVVTGLVNSLSTYWMEKMTKTYVIFHILVLVTCSIALLAKCDNRHNAKYVFTDVNSTSGWTPVGFSWLFGFLSVSWTMTDYDATAHITEEISNPEVKAPWAISMAMLFTYLAGFLFNIVLCFVMGDMASILESPMEQPVAQIFYNVLGKGGGIFFTICAFFIIKFVTFTAMQSLARTVFAFSRDRLLPFSNVWVKINPLTQTPIYAVWISVFWAIAINLIGLGSYAAIAGVFNVTAIALDWSYCIPIFCKMVFGQFEPGPWHMGKFSMFVNGFAILWTFFVTIIFILPTVRPVAGDTMNYAIAFLGAILIFSAIFWYLSGKNFYTGPLIEAEVADNQSGNVKNGSGSSGEFQRDEKKTGHITT
ncbi:MAG: hypothetical protein L6R39_004015 [Caloplaca ligustica]|nr:MAG: hypothetical protein L6R39_004015 [Caloplaca ligustica]